MRRLIEVPQHTETSLQHVEGTDWNYYYAYIRAAEARQHDEIGQDYLCICEEEDGLWFALCDGVGMSYYGEVAAKRVGDELIRWLAQFSDSFTEPGIIAEELQHCLHRITSDVTQIIDSFPMPAHIRGLHREVLLSKKQTGSSTVYGCGRIDRPSERYPDGRLLFAWHGDIRIRIWSAERERSVLLGERFDSAQQWNSVAGHVGGSPSVWFDTLANFGFNGALISYSDGLQIMDKDSTVHREILEERLQQASLPSTSDDIAMLCVKWNFCV